MRISDWSSDVCSSDLEQRTGERVQIERIGPGGRDQLAELLDLAGLQSLGLVVQRPQFRVIAAHLSHLLSLAPLNGAAASHDSARAEPFRSRNAPKPLTQTSESGSVSLYVLAHLRYKGQYSRPYDAITFIA